MLKLRLHKENEQQLTLTRECMTLGCPSATE